MQAEIDQRKTDAAEDDDEDQFETEQTLANVAIQHRIRRVCRIELDADCLVDLVGIFKTVPQRLLKIADVVGTCADDDAATAIVAPVDVITVFGFYPIGCGLAGTVASELRLQQGALGFRPGSHARSLV